MNLKEGSKIPKALYCEERLILGTLGEVGGRERGIFQQGVYSLLVKQKLTVSVKN